MKKLLEAITELDKLGILTVNNIRSTDFGCYIVRVCDAEDWRGSAKATLYIDDDSNEIISILGDWCDDQIKANE